MHTFLNDDFLLETNTAARLYHDFAKDQPIIDYHNHLSPKDIANDRKFNDITEAWLEGDHYKWRAMRANGVDESYVTGSADNKEKFRKWAQTVPYTMRNPLYHWTHLELKRYFEINDLLNGQTADQIYETASGRLRSDDYGCRGLLEKMKVESICTTDDPLDDLAYHKQIADSNWQVKVYPTFRPDKAMAVDNAGTFKAYVDQLEKVADVAISNYQDYLEAIQKRHDFFASMGCKLSDHGLNHIFAEDYTQADVEQAFQQVRKGNTLDTTAALKLKSALLFEFAVMDHAKGFTQQFHLGALRNNNQRMVAELGPDTGYDSIGDFSHAYTMSKFFDKLEQHERLTKTIVYNLNPSDNYVFATMMGNYQDGKTPGKMQFGTGWWFLDQKEAMEWQMNALSNIGLISQFVGMLTDSRSFLSFPRHEYFRRILCNLFGNDIEQGLLPNDIDWIGNMISNICYHNAKEYFKF